MNTDDVAGLRSTRLSVLGTNTAQSEHEGDAIKIDPQFIKAGVSVSVDVAAIAEKSRRLIDNRSSMRMGEACNNCSREVTKRSELSAAIKARSLRDSTHSPRA